MSYTKGPWTAYIGEEIHGVLDSDGKHLCELWMRKQYDGVANAHLISAAPDMLEALKRIEPIVDALEYLSPDKAVDGSIAKQIRAAIAKAEGGEA